MGDRFNNVSTDDLVARHLDAVREAEELAEAVKSRLRAECKIKPHHVYRIVRSGSHGQWKERFIRRRMLVVNIRVEDGWDIKDDRKLVLYAEGPLDNKAATTRDGFNIRYHHVTPDQLDMTSAVPFTGRRRS